MIEGEWKGESRWFLAFERVGEGMGWDGVEYWAFLRARGIGIGM